MMMNDNGTNNNHSETNGSTEMAKTGTEEVPNNSDQQQLKDGEEAKQEELLIKEEPKKQEEEKLVGDVPTATNTTTTTTTTTDEKVPMPAAEQQQKQEEKPLFVNKQQPNTLKNASNNARPDANCFLRCRGLPYSAGEAEMRKFFADYELVDVMFTNGIDGRPSGECYVQFASREQASGATAMDRQMMGKRYVEVFTVADVEMDNLLKRLQTKRDLSTKGFIRIRGLPYTCTRADVEKFFQGFSVEEVVFGNTGTTSTGAPQPGSSGLDHRARPSGEGMVKFGAAEEADKALALNGQHMGNRYLEIFKSDGIDYEGFKQRTHGKITPLRALMSTDPWAPPPAAASGYGPAAGFGAYGPHGGGTGYGPGAYGHGGGAYGGGGGAYSAYGSGYDQRTPGGPMQGRGGQQYGDQRSNRYSPYGASAAAGYGSGGSTGSGRSGGGAYSAGGGAGRAPRRGPPPVDYGYGDAEGYGQGFGGGYGQGGGGGGRGGGGGPTRFNDHLLGPNKIYMQGLPFHVTPMDIERFFAPLACLDILVGTTHEGRPNGDGIVEFQSPDAARQAMMKDRDYIGSRYIELIPAPSAKLPGHVRYDSIGGGSRLGVVGGVQPSPRAPSMPPGPLAAQQYGPPGHPQQYGIAPQAAQQQHPYGPPAHQSQQQPAYPAQPSIAPQPQSLAAQQPYGGHGATYPPQQQQQAVQPVHPPQQQQQYGANYGYGTSAGAGAGQSQQQYGAGSYGAYGAGGGAAAASGTAPTAGANATAPAAGTDYSNYYGYYAGGYGSVGGAAGGGYGTAPQGMGGGQESGAGVGAVQQQQQQPKAEYNWPPAQY